MADPLELSRRVDRQLVGGERILWVGAPNRGHLLSPQDVYLIPFSLLWGGFALFWEVGASRASGAFSLFGLPFLLVGQYVIWGRFVVLGWRRRNTVYAVTDQRVLVIRSTVGGSESVNAAYLTTLPAVNVKRRADGSGTIMFGNTPMFMARSNSWSVWNPDATGVPTFANISDVAQVEQIVHEHRAGPTPWGPGGMSPTGGMPAPPGMPPPP